MSPFDKIVTKAQRETAGPRTTRKFAFQRNWAIAEMLENHSSSADYVYGFEYHDDVVRFDSESPTRVEFFQIKGKSNENWTVTTLTGGSGQTGLSVICKLYEHLVSFPDCNPSASFVTNANFSFIRQDIISPFCASLLSPDDKKKFEKCISDALPLEKDIKLDAIFFIKTSLSEKDSDRHITGIIHDFLLKELGRDTAGSLVEKFQITLADEIRRKNDYPPEKICNLKELFSRKCVTKGAIMELLNSLRRQYTEKPRFEWVEYELREHRELREVLALRREWRRYEGERFQVTNTHRIKLEDTLDNIFAEEGIAEMELNEAIDTAHARYREQNPVRDILHSEGYVKVVIIWKYCEHHAL